MTTDRQALDATAFSLITLLSFLWGVQQVVVKLTAPYVALVMQGGIRSALATLLVLIWARSRGIALFQRDGTLLPGLIAGVLFSVEFVFIYAGRAHTGASRLVVFLYLAPPLTALGLARCIPGERLNARQWGGARLVHGHRARVFRRLLDGRAYPRLLVNLGAVGRRPTP